MSNKEQNILLQKSQLGKIKKGFHNLPSENHTYGKAPQKDQYGARQVVSGWQEHNVSKIKEPEKNFVAMNKEGIKQGFIDSKQITDYRKNNQILCKVKEGQKYYGVSIPNEQFVYGIPNRPSTPMKNVICNTYAEQQLELKRQRDAVVNMLQKDGKKSPPKVQVVAKVNPRVQPKRKEVEQFKIAKFKNVQSKIKPLISSQNQNK